jgi:hypothetical protein
MMNTSYVLKCSGTLLRTLTWSMMKNVVKSTHLALQTSPKSDPSVLKVVKLPTCIEVMLRRKYLLIIYKRWPSAKSFPRWRSLSTQDYLKNIPLRMVAYLDILNQILFLAFLNLGDKIFFKKKKWYCVTSKNL